VRIAVDARQLLPPLTGIGRYTLSLLEHMVAAGDEWYLYSDRPLPVQTAAWADSHGAVIRHGRAPRRGLTSLWHANVSFSRWARQDRIDVFWSPRHHLPAFLPRGMRTLLTIHDLVWQRYPASMPPANRLLERLLMGFSLRRADRVVTVSEFTAREIRHFYPGVSAAIAVVPSAGRSFSQITPAPLAAPFFLFVGTGDPRKNLPRLLEAFAEAVQTGDLPHQLVVVGAAGWGLPDLQRRAAALGLSARLHFPGFVSDAELAGYYQAASALLLPSLYEGFGLPVVEAMQFGVPVIVSDRASLPEVAGQAALLVDPESTSSIAKAISRLATDPGLHKELSSSSRERGAVFSWEQAASATLTLLHQLHNDSGTD